MTQDIFLADGLLKPEVSEKVFCYFCHKTVGNQINCSVVHLTKPIYVRCLECVDAE
jgi:hypothetical protein